MKRATGRHRGRGRRDRACRRLAPGAARTVASPCSNAASRRRRDPRRRGNAGAGHRGRLRRGADARAERLAAARAWPGFAAELAEAGGVDCGYRRNGCLSRRARRATSCRGAAAAPRVRSAARPRGGVAARRAPAATSSRRSRPRCAGGSFTPDDGAGRSAGAHRARCWPHSTPRRWPSTPGPRSSRPARRRADRGRAHRRRRRRTRRASSSSRPAAGRARARGCPRRRCPPSGRQGPDRAPARPAPTSP